MHAGWLRELLGIQVGMDSASSLGLVEVVVQRGKVMLRLELLLVMEGDVQLLWLLLLLLG